MDEKNSSKKNRELKQLIEYSNNYTDFNKISDCESMIIYDILNIQESERQRIARELHDSSVQNLIHLIHMIELGSMYIDQDSIRAKLELENCIKFLKSTIDEMRDIIFNLRPMAFDDLGFKQCIDNLIINEKSRFKNFEIEYNVCELDNENNLLLVTIYRVIKEVLENALKHSNGDKIILNVMKKNGKCFIYMKDNGKGFSSKELDKKKNKHFGISIIKERIELLQGKISIITRPEKGTEIKIQIPLI